MSDQRSAGLFIALGQHLKSAFKWSFPLLSAIQRERIQERRGRGDVIKTAQGFSFCCLKCSLPFLFFNNCFVYIKAEWQSLGGGSFQGARQCCCFPPRALSAEMGTPWPCCCGQVKALPSPLARKKHLQDRSPLILLLLCSCARRKTHSGDKVLLFPPQSPAFSKYKACQEAASKAPELGDRSGGAQRDEEGL